MWPSSRLTDLLGIEVPIVQAPMKGTSTPGLAAAVCNAGALGSLGCSGLDPAGLAADVAELRKQTNGGFNLNFFACGAAQPDPEAIQRTARALAPFFAEFGLDTPSAPLDPLPAPFGPAILDALLADPPAVVSFHFGVPPGDALARLKSAGCRILSTATNVAEARALEAAGVDAIIAQGWEAGGHRGSFAAEPADVGIGLVALVPQVVDAVSVPVIAAGGIADGRGIAAAFALGADGVQMGSAFAACPESAAGPLHRRALAEATDADTCLTLAHSGRPARARRTRYIDAMAQDPGPLPVFPLMYRLSAPLGEAEDAMASRDFQFLLYGQAAGLSRPLPASALVDRLVAEARAAFAHCAAGA